MNNQNKTKQDSHTHKHPLPVYTSFGVEHKYTELVLLFFK